ncbi:CoA transferase [soil metagenome]
MSKPFANIRILDFSHVISGPYATELLTMMGADVIRFERPGGDETRTFCSSPELLAKGLGSAYLTLNAGKRSVAIDLKRSESIEMIRRLVPTADVIVENFRPGTMARLGLGYEDLKQIKPELVYCSISGYGQDGPERDSPAYDGAIQAASGIMSLTGHPETGPVRVGFPFSDVATGSAAALGIAGALYRKLATGQGQYIDIAMVDASLSMMSPIVGYWMIGGEVPSRLGNLAWSRRPSSDLFEASDDYLMLVVNREEHLRIFCETIGIGDLPGRPEFATWALRSHNRAAFKSAINTALAKGKAVDWERQLKAAGIAVARVASVDEVISSPQMAHRDLIIEVEGTVGHEQPIRVMNAPFKYAFDPCGTTRPPPGCGQHTDEVLGEVGYSSAEIAMLRERGVMWELTGAPKV